MWTGTGFAGLPAVVILSEIYFSRYKPVIFNLLHLMARVNELLKFHNTLKNTVFTNVTKNRCNFDLLHQMATVVLSVFISFHWTV